MPKLRQWLRTAPELRVETPLTSFGGEHMGTFTISHQNIKTGSTSVWEVRFFFIWEISTATFSDEQSGLSIKHW
jgi:hypothetical protein